MSHGSANPGRSLLRWFADRTRAAGDRLYAGPDARAREHGWRIVPLYGGLGRLYRDPRFDVRAREARHVATQSSARALVRGPGEGRTR